MRNRKGAKDASSASAKSPSTSPKSKSKREAKPDAKSAGKKERPELPKILVGLQWFAVITVMVMPVLVIAYCFNKWGPNYFLPDFMISLTLTSDDWREVFKNRTMVMIGGPHRGGTTVLWEAIRTHPKVSDFGTERESGLDFSEGVFAHSVYPSYGVGDEFQRGNKMEGVGRYALADEFHVHRTAEHASVTVENQVKVLNKWGFLWDLTDKPILLEKSPVNAVVSTLLQALFNANNEGWKPQPPEFGGGESFVKFIFTTRDPMANAYAQQVMSFNKNEPLERLLQNWLAIHEYLEEDLPALQYVHRLRFEEFDADPVGETLKIWEWLGLERDEEAIKSVKSLVSQGQNAKYVINHCRKMKENPGFKDQYLQLADIYNERVLALNLGYDLKSKFWTCAFLDEPRA